MQIVTVLSVRSVNLTVWRACAALIDVSRQVKRPCKLASQAVVAEPAINWLELYTKRIYRAGVQCCFMFCVVFDWRFDRPWVKLLTRHARPAA